MLGSIPRYVTRMAVALVCGLTVLASPAHAAFTEYDTETYDVLTLGVPRFVNTNYIDLLKITHISKFRSGAGHDYSDGTQFNAESIKIVGKPIERCRSMKHYFRPPDAGTNVFAPVSGVISRIFQEEVGTQIQITSDVQPAFTFIIFHVVAPAPVVVGSRVEEGQLLGHHLGPQTDSDIAVAVHALNGYHLVSYFETLTDSAFAAFQARGIAARDDMIIDRATRDVAPLTCSGTSFTTTNPTDYVPLTGGAAAQQITMASIGTEYHAGGPPLTVTATASSGLPVTITPTVPKVCMLDGSRLYFRRPGTCTLEFTQNGDANTFAAPTLYRIITVLPAGAPYPTLPRLGAIRPPSETGSQSYLRFIAGINAGTVTLTLTDAATGQDKLRWTSPTIPALAAPQYAIATIEATAPAGYQRPAMYGLRIESATTLRGSIQHVLYHPVAGTLTNVTTCDTGLGAATQVIGNVHTSNLTEFPSWMVIHNIGPFDYVRHYLTLYDAATGSLIGGYANDPVMASNRSAFVTVNEIEEFANVPPGSRKHYVIYAGSAPIGGFVQHLVNNQRAGVITDMTAVCALSGGPMAAPGAPLRGGALFGGTQSASRSFLRLYNANTFPGTVAVTLYDAATGVNVGQWTSPSIAPFTELQVSIGTLETELGITKRDIYEFKVETDIDGYLQHVLWRAADGTLTNLSTCKGAVGVDPYTLVGVHTSRLGGQGYPSQIAVVNTGTAAQTVTLGLYDARDDTKLGTYATTPIPGGAQAMLDVSAMETEAEVTPTAGMSHYVVRADAPFTGFLQHLVNNQRSGVITDMTTICGM